MTATTEANPNQHAETAPLTPAVCEQMARTFPLGADVKIVKSFQKPDQPDGPYPHAVMADSRQQILVMAGRHPYELMNDNARRVASRALRESEFSNMGMSPTGGIFAMLDGQPVREAETLKTRQRECVFGRAFLLTQSSL